MYLQMKVSKKMFKMKKTCEFVCEKAQHYGACTAEFVCEKAQHYGARTAVATVLTVIAQASQAAIDTTAVTAAMTEGGTAIAVIGAAVLVVYVGIAVFKWLKRPIA